MKRQSILVLAVLCLAFVAGNGWRDLTLPNTGAGGISVETNYVLSYAPTLDETPMPMTAYVTPRPTGGWAAAPAGSEWISPTRDFHETTRGYHFYRLSFAIPGLTAITGQWATDNNAQIFLNGKSTGITKGLDGYWSVTPFSITSGFTGNDTLTFRVWEEHSGSPTGLLVTNLLTNLDPGFSLPGPKPVPLPGAARRARLELCRIAAETCM